MRIPVQTHRVKPPKLICHILLHKVRLAAQTALETRLLACARKHNPIAGDGYIRLQLPLRVATLSRHILKRSSPCGNHFPGIKAPLLNLRKRYRKFLN